MKQNYFLKKLAFSALMLFGASTVWGQDVYDYTGDLQFYTVPADVYYIEIETTGAEGGNGMSANSGIAGKGARMTGSFAVNPGDNLVILVGEQGESAQYVGGGGGGSFVWTEADAELLIAAGGGGGSGATDGGDLYKDGTDASITENGVNGNGIPDGAGTAGEGGTTPTTCTNWAGGGAGWISGGNIGTDHGCTYECTGGQLILDGAAGGSGGGSDASSADGGYGGGGGGNARCGAVGGGGGGGYSGGGAGGEVVLGEFNGGGGAGSFNAGDNQDNSAGVGTGNGQVIITPICDPIVISYSVSPETLPGNGSIDITVTGGGGAYTYDWDNDGTGDFDDSEDLIGLTAGTYTIVVQDESFCENVAEVIEVESVIGIAEASLQVSIYPNPTNGQIRIEQNGTFTYQVFGIDGTILLNGNGIDGITVDLSSYAKGMYYVSVKNASGNAVYPVAKK
jgi:hypothetical protein